MEPLRGIRIIEVTTNASGPLATGILADQGADVIRLETIGAGDPARHVGGSRAGVGAYHAQMNRNKRSMSVDLKNPLLREPLLRLIRTADVFVQNSRPCALDRSGFGFEDLHKVHPALIYVSISGFGATGPAAHQRVYDPVIQAVSGFAAAQGAGGDPQLVRTIASDKVAALTASQAATIQRTTAWMPISVPSPMLRCHFGAPVPQSRTTSCGALEPRIQQAPSAVARVTLAEEPSGSG